MESLLAVLSSVIETLKICLVRDKESVESWERTVVIKTIKACCTTDYEKS